jgi:AcrR family transcriptional regulator
MDKKSRIMAAAEGLFRTGQFHEITLDEVARLADVGKGTIYQYFASKDDLFFQIAIAAFDHVCDLLHQDAASDDRPEQHLRRVCDVISRFAQERRLLFRLIHAEGERTSGQGGPLRQTWNEHRKKLTRIIAEIIHAGVERREVRQDISPEAAAEYFLGMIRTRVTELDGLADADRGQDALISLFVHGLAADTNVNEPMPSGSGTA